MRFSKIVKNASINKQIKKVLKPEENDGIIIPLWKLKQLHIEELKNKNKKRKR